MVRDPRRGRSLLRSPEHCVVDQSLSDFRHPQILPIHSPELPLLEFFLLLTVWLLHVLNKHWLGQFVSRVDQNGSEQADQADGPLRLSVMFWGRIQLFWAFLFNP